MISTTLVRITDSQFLPVKKGFEIITSLEGENPGQSIKDRIVHGELSCLMQAGDLKKGSAIAEISAGSTALSLAYYCRFFDLRCSLFVPLSLDPETVKFLEGLGAELYQMDPQNAFETYNKFTHETGIRPFNQFGNLKLRRHYRVLAECIRQKFNVSVIAGAVGTGHSLTGIAENLNPSGQVISAEPLKVAAVSGIRNLKLESFGEKDPCKDILFQRFELNENEFYPHSKIDTDHGTIEITDSFRVVLGAILKFAEHQSPVSVFAVGAKNFRVK